MTERDLPGVSRGSIGRGATIEPLDPARECRLVAVEWALGRAANWVDKPDFSRIKVLGAEEPCERTLDDIQDALWPD